MGRCSSRLRESLWTSDGTGGGTVQVTQINVGSMININGTLFLSAAGPTGGTELWKSDGTAAGTVMVKDINPSGSSSPASLTDVGGTLFFVANDGVHGTELWKSDGTGAGTVLVKDIVVGSNSSNPMNLTDVNGTLFFVANDGTHGYELWASDGTAAGTRMVKDIASGSRFAFWSISTSNYLVNVGGVLMFNANDFFNGEELCAVTERRMERISFKTSSRAAVVPRPRTLSHLTGNCFSKRRATRRERSFGRAMERPPGRFR